MDDNHDTDRSMLYFEADMEVGVSVWKQAQNSLPKENPTKNSIRFDDDLSKNFPLFVINSSISLFLFNVTVSSNHLTIWRKHGGSPANSMLLQTTKSLNSMGFHNDVAIVILITFSSLVSNIISTNNTAFNSYQSLKRPRVTTSAAIVEKSIFYFSQYFTYTISFSLLY